MQKGYLVIVMMADSFTVERRKLMPMHGAKVVLTPSAKQVHAMYQKGVALAKAKGWFLAGQLGPDANVEIHESMTAREGTGKDMNDKELAISRSSLGHQMPQSTRRRPAGSRSPSP